MTQPLKTGDLVRLNGRYRGKVVLASENGRSVMVALEDGLRIGGGILLNFAPLLIDYEKETVTELVTGAPIEVEVAETT